MRRIVLVALSILGACSPKATGTAPLTLTGQLTSGTFDTPPLSTQSAPSLAGYQVSCVTFGTPPVAATATTDANGNFTLTMNALDTPFGCFVLDPSGASVASLVFTEGSASGLTASFSSNADLGVVIVDTSSGLAGVVLPSSGMVVSSPPSANCPLGTWLVSYPALAGDTCNSVVPTATLWIAQLPSGQYVASYIFGPTNNGNGGCTYQSQTNLPATFANNVFTVVVANSATSVLNIDAACAASSGAVTFTNCASCDASGTCMDSGTGTTTCVLDYNATRQ